MPEINPVYAFELNANHPKVAAAVAKGANIRNVAGSFFSLSQNSWGNVRGRTLAGVDIRSTPRVNANFIPGGAAARLEIDAPQLHFGATDNVKMKIAEDLQGELFTMKWSQSGLPTWNSSATPLVYENSAVEPQDLYANQTPWIRRVKGETTADPSPVTENDAIGFKTFGFKRGLFRIVGYTAADAVVTNFTCDAELFYKVSGADSGVWKSYTGSVTNYVALDVKELSDTLGREVFIQITNVAGTTPAAVDYIHVEWKGIP